MLHLKVLLLEDEPKMARVLTQIFAEEGYSVDLCTTGADAIEQAGAGSYSLIVLDWMVPAVDGLAACREMRRRGVTTPILMLTARGSTPERVLGLDAGADDYLTKPFEIDELMARARALVRRTAGVAKVQCGDLEIDRLARRVTLAGKELVCTDRELAVLSRLAHRAEQVRRVGPGDRDVHLCAELDLPGVPQATRLGRPHRLRRRCRELPAPRLLLWAVVP